MKKLPFLAAAILLLASLASAQDVTYNYDQKADFSKFKTYKWVANGGSDPVDELTAKQIASAIDAQLATKGLTKRDAGDTDLLLCYQVAVNKEKEVTSFNTGYGYGPGWGPRWSGGYGGGYSSASTSTIYIGALSLDMYDAASKTLVWRGLASKQIDTKAKPEKREKNLAKGMEKLLKNYPPKQKK
jgi:hypothetical protein